MEGMFVIIGEYRFEKSQIKGYYPRWREHMKIPEGWFGPDVIVKVQGVGGTITHYIRMESDEAVKETIAALDTIFMPTPAAVVASTVLN